MVRNWTVVLMNINLSPQRRDDTLTVFKVGNVLSINGESFDFSRMVEGDTLPRAAIASAWFAGDVSMVGGELQLTLLLPIPANYSQEQAFPVPLTNVGDGQVVLPAALPEPEALAVEEIQVPAEDAE